MRLAQQAKAVINVHVVRDLVFSVDPFLEDKPKEKAISRHMARKPN